MQDYNKATWGQNFVASVAGSSASLIVSAPLDVIKTRIQNRNFENPESGFRILTKMARNEGLSSFFKGLVPKVRDSILTTHIGYADANLMISSASDDRPQAHILVLARSDTDSRV